jgi:hypothetical protein
VDNYYTLVPVKGNEQRYKELIPRWWNWVYSENCDRNNIFDDVTFLRDDIIGPQLKLDVGISRGSRNNVPHEPEKKVTVEAGTNLFFPIYHVCSVREHPFVEGGECGDNCAKAAQVDLSNCYDRWATISINGQSAIDITNDWDNQYSETELELKVPGPNNLKREAGFYLDGRDEPYKGIAAGTYLLFNNLQSGQYNLDFGGRATDFQTRSLYQVNVK